MNKYVTMLKTEIKLSFRGMDMVIFALCLPVVMVVLLGIIYGNQPAFEGASYSFLEQSFGAISTIAICAGGVMGLPLVISDYRQKKILKRYKVTPTNPILLLTVQVSIYAIYSLLSLILVYLVGSLFFGVRLPGSVGIFLASYLLVMLSTFSIEAKLEELQKELLKRANSKKDYNGITEEIHRLRDLKQNALVASAEQEGMKKRIAEMREFLDSQPTEVLEYDEQLVRRLIEKVTVYDERFEVEFKSGMTVDVER